MATTSTVRKDFPMPPAELDGGRILLIEVSESDTSRASFLAGVAHWTGSALRVEGAEQTVEASGSERALAGFDPALLPRLVVPHALPPIEALAAGVRACVVTLSRSPSHRSLAVRQPFFGLALGPDREVFLMQGDPDDWESDTDEEYDETI